MSNSIWVEGVVQKIPEALLENRRTIEGNVIGLIWKDIATLDEVSFDARDFLTVEGRFYYSVAKELRNNAHLNQLDEVAVASNLSEDILKRFEEYGGFQAIENITEMISLNNRAAYLVLCAKATSVSIFISRGSNCPRRA